MRDAPFFVIEHGTVDIIDRRPHEGLWFARINGGTFIGDVSMFTGEPTVAAGVAVEPTSTIVFERPSCARCWQSGPSSAGARSAASRLSLPTSLDCQAGPTAQTRRRRR
jgi:Cyclic nucleotide-binding domain